ncbi:MAG: ATP synthase F1 subunit delta [Chitinophagaceae bacterium]|nr:ATP synthase F1 subunit delta [Chitinophagaceae bacterium]
MNNPRLANRYAKSLIDIATEQNQLDAVQADMKLLKSICKSNPDFVSMLVSPIIQGSVKGKIIEAVTKSRIGNLSNLFINLLVRKNRENSLPEIVEAYIEQYNKVKNIQKVKVTTAVPMSDELKNEILAKVKAGGSAYEVEMETAVKDELIGGFVLETENTLIDASILRDLKDIRKQFLNNDYIHKLR